jgi:uncharacterized protein
MTSSTADPLSAQAHARAMANNVVETMPIVPPSEGLLWEEIVASGGYTSRRLARGSRIGLTDVHGDACASLLLFNAECPVERLNVADTLKVQWNAYLGAGKLLLSDMGRVMASILEDEAQTHDCFCGASNPAIHARKYGASGNYGPYPSARERFLIALAKYGLGRKDVHPCINLFKGVEIAADGSTQLNVEPFTPNRKVTLRAEMDLILIVANCPHVLDRRSSYSVTPLKLTAWHGPVTAEDDTIRNATPEGLRAFLNTEDYYRR